METTRECVTGVVGQILGERGICAPMIRDEDTLTGTLRLDSLDLAVLVVRLEQKLGHDPFRDGRGAVATVGELVAVYEAAEGNA